MMTNKEKNNVDCNIYKNFCQMWDVIKLTDYVILNWQSPIDVTWKILNLYCLDFCASQKIPKLMQHLA